jgi:hypothetical protein
MAEALRLNYNLLKRQMRATEQPHWRTPAPAFMELFGPSGCAGGGHDRA